MFLTVLNQACKGLQDIKLIKMEDLMILDFPTQASVLDSIKHYGRL